MNHAKYNIWKLQYSSSTAVVLVHNLFVPRTCTVHFQIALEQNLALCTSNYYRQIFYLYRYRMTSEVLVLPKVVGVLYAVGSTSYVVGYWICISVTFVKCRSISSISNFVRKTVQQYYLYVRTSKYFVHWPERRSRVLESKYIILHERVVEYCTRTVPVPGKYTIDLVEDESSDNLGPLLTGRFLVVFG
jgi:hypothetical protein